MPLGLPTVSAVALALGVIGAGAASATSGTQSDRLVFASPHGGQTQIESVSTDGTGGRQLTTSPGSSQSPFWSRDGRQIVFVSNRTKTWQIYVMNADGTGQHALTRPSGEG